MHRRSIEGEDPERMKRWSSSFSLFAGRFAVSRTRKKQRSTAPRRGNQGQSEDVCKSEKRQRPSESRERRKSWREEGQGRAQENAHGRARRREH
jgi:hypothetical protein